MKKIIIATLALSSVIFAGNGEELVKKNGCTACHAVDTHKAAPPFAGIGMRNKKFEGDNAKSTIINSIKNGSKGKYKKFANSAMPAFKTLSDKDLSDIADYILAQSDKAKAMHKNGGGCKGEGMGMHKGMGQGMGMQKGVQ